MTFRRLAGCAAFALACDGAAPSGDGLAPAPLAADTGAPPAPAPAPPVTDPPRTLRGFAQECGVALGPVPGFDCMEDAVEVPITVGGARLAPEAYTDRMDCDKPVMLTGNCVAFSRVGHKTGRTWDNREDPDVDWVFTCRRNGVAPGPTGGVFGDIAMIGHRKSTGETCFFQAFPSEPWTRAPAPLEPPEETPPGAPTAEAFWLPPGATAGIACHRCHDNDPWIHSPWIDQARHPNDPARTLVPPGGGRDAPYVVVGRAFQPWVKDLRHINPAGNGCVACHRIGTGGTCGTFARYSTGDPGFYPVSPSAAAFPASHWMPPGSAGTEAAWDAVWGDDIAEILDCCANPGNPACGTEAIPTARP